MNYSVGMPKHRMFPWPGERRHPHWRQQGGGKYPHTTWESAVESAERMTEKNQAKGLRFEPYHCTYCDRYHIGRGLLNSTQHAEQELWRLELGDRAATHMILENHKPPEKRLLFITQRVHAGIRKRLYPNFWHGHRKGRR